SAFCDVPAQAAERFVISCDYGTVNPSSFGLWGLVGDVWYRLCEYYYDSRAMGSQKTDEEHYASLCELAGDRRIEKVIVDPSAASFIQTIQRHNRFNVQSADNRVIDGIRMTSTALRDGKIKICNTCADSMREFGLYRWDDNGVKDCPVKENDHAMDDIRYFVTTVCSGDDDGFFAVAAYR
ncbi:MAG: PBSX family phage terminase large subunit, partial [Lachnospiraceae bacterium]|nr:PBSX family phage terminase large subunit [Lachnospiraceae bacterium]